MLSFNDLHGKKYTIIIIVSSVVLISIFFLSSLLIESRVKTKETKQATPTSAMSETSTQLSPTPIPANYYVLPTPLSDANIPTAPPTPIPQEGDIILDGIAVKDFTKTAARITEDGDVILAETTSYQIVFYKQSQEFVISIIGLDFEKSRINAESAFLVNLGIDKPNACRLFVTEYVPNTVKNKHSGEVLPLSFCYHEHDE